MVVCTSSVWQLRLERRHLEGGASLAGLWPWVPSGFFPFPVESGTTEKAFRGAAGRTRRPPLPPQRARVGECEIQQTGMKAQWEEVRSHFRSRSRAGNHRLAWSRPLEAGGRFFFSHVV